MIPAPVAAIAIANNSLTHVTHFSIFKFKDDLIVGKASVPPATVCVSTYCWLDACFTHVIIVYCVT